MKKILKILNSFAQSYFLLTLIIIFPNSNINSAQSGITRLVGHWALSAGPWFADAIHYVALFSEEYSAKVFGDEEADFQLEAFVHHVLHECGISNSNKIKVKLIKPEARDFVLSAVVCTDSAIFINPTIYNFLSKNEQRALIAQASVMMQKNHLGMNATVLALIPIATHLITEGARALLKQFKDNELVKNNIIAMQAYKGARYALGFWATKLAINSILASLYFQYQSQRYNDLTAKKLGTTEDLISYQTKLSEFIKKQTQGLKQTYRYR